MYLLVSFSFYCLCIGKQLYKAQRFVAEFLKFKSLDLELVEPHAHQNAVSYWKRKHDCAKVVFFQATTLFETVTSYHVKIMAHFDQLSPADKLLLKQDG